MKVCPKCDREYGDEAGFCLIDGTALVDGDVMPTVAIRSTGADPTLVMTQRRPAGTRLRVPLIVAAVVGMIVLVTISVLLLAKMYERGNEVKANQMRQKNAAAQTPTPRPAG